MSTWSRLFVLACILTVVQNSVALQKSWSQISLLDVTASTGINFEHYSGRTGKNYIVETITTGIVTFDFDNDGLLDIYFPNAAPLPQSPSQLPQENRLYRNLGNMQFEDVTENSGAGDVGFALGVTASDLDNDGDQDLIIANFGENAILENLGTGSFVRRALPSGADYKRVAAGVATLDADNDGFLDLYFSNYVKFDYRDINRQLFGIPLAPGPKDFEPDTDTLFHNIGDWNFRDVSDSSGIASVAGQGMGVVAFDFDGDGDVDLFVCNDSAPNFLFENLGDLNFEEIGLLAGVAFDITGSKQASMGVDVGDVNRDGLLDLVATNFANEIPNIYLNSGEGYFDDVGAKMGMGRLLPPVTWGLALADFNNDRFLDLFVGAGHLIKSIEVANNATRFAMPNHVFLNKEGKWFEDVSASCPDVLKPRVTRGVCVDDLDNDGAIDVVVANLDDSPQVLSNKSPHRGNYLTVELIGTRSNRDAVGAVVEGLAGGVKVVQTVVSGRGYQGDFGRRLHFGLGEHDSLSEVTVKWPTGKTQAVGKVSANQHLLLVEDRETL